MDTLFTVAVALIVFVVVVYVIKALFYGLVIVLAYLGLCELKATIKEHMDD